MEENPEPRVVEVPLGDKILGGERSSESLAEERGGQRERDLIEGSTVQTGGVDG